MGLGSPHKRADTGLLTFILVADDQNFITDKNYHIKSSQNVYFCDFTDNI